MGEKSARRPATHTHSPTIWIPEYAMGPDHTHIRSVDGGDTRCARSYGLQSPQSSETSRGQSQHLVSHGCINRGIDIQSLIVRTVKVGHPSAWFPTDSACGGVAIGSGPWSRHGRWSHLVSHGFSRGGGQPLRLNHESDRGSRTGSAERSFGRSASRRSLSDTQRRSKTTRLGGCLNFKAFQPLHWNDIAPELGESKQARDGLTT